MCYDCIYARYEIKRRKLFLWCTIVLNYSQWLDQQRRFLRVTPVNVLRITRHTRRSKSDWMFALIIAHNPNAHSQEIGFTVKRGKQLSVILKTHNVNVVMVSGRKSYSTAMSLIWATEEKHDRKVNTPGACISTFLYNLKLEELRTIYESIKHWNTRSDYENRTLQYHRHRVIPKHREIVQLQRQVCIVKMYCLSMHNKLSPL